MNAFIASKNVDFICKQLSITDDADFGCTIEFSDSIDTDSKDIQEILNSSEKYLMIQRSYPEDEYENDWYTIETSESDIELNQKDKIIIKLKMNSIEVSWSSMKLVIGLELNDSELHNLDRILKKRFREKIILID